MTEQKYVFRFFIEWGGGCIWPGNDASYDQLGLGPYDKREPCPIPIPLDIIQKCNRIAEWHDKSLNWVYPQYPGPWRQEECDLFNQEVSELFEEIKNTLGNKYSVVNEQDILSEDPEFDEYLLNSKGFKRKNKK